MIEKLFLKINPKDGVQVRIYFAMPARGGHVIR